MLLRTPHDALCLIRSALDSLLADEACAALVASRPLRLRVGLVDPDCVIYVQAADGIVRLARPDDPTDGIVALDGATACRVAAGDIDLEREMGEERLIADESCRWLIEAFVANPGVLAGVARRTRGVLDLPVLAG